METINTDVLVIGAGAAGIRAALAVSGEGVPVVMASPAGPGKSGSTFSSVSRGWGIQALVDTERTDENLKAFYDDIMRVGLDRCDPTLVQILVEESGARIKDLMNWGIRFKTNPHGTFLRAKGCFSSAERAFITEDFKNLVGAFQSILQHSAVKFIPCYITDLAIADGICFGAFGIVNNHCPVQIRAKATILAGGGGAGIFEDHLVNGDQVGEGYALARKAGATLMNMEFIQFMLGIKNGRHRSFLPLDGLKNPGALVDDKGNDILEKYISDPVLRNQSIADRRKHYPFSCRDSSYLVDTAVALSNRMGMPVRPRQEGHRKENARVSHFAHAFNGGIRINEWAESTVPGLFAAGESAAGPHGADRIGGCMMTATQVFGQRAGVAAARRSVEIQSRAWPEIQLPEWIRFHKARTQRPDELNEIRSYVQSVMTRHVIFPREEKGLKCCLSGLRELRHQLHEQFEASCFSLKEFRQTDNMILTGQIVAKAALLRRESLGAHFR